MDTISSIQQPIFQENVSSSTHKPAGISGNSVSSSQVKGQSSDQVTISKEGHEKNIQSQSSVNTPQDTGSPTGASLSQEELTKLNKLKARDTEVRAHEQAHLSAAGGYATGGASFTLQKGPDGNSYAVGGEVGIDLSKESDPSATIQKMQTVKRAALAPASPSSTDRQVAAQASVKEAQARQELLQEQQEMLLAGEEAPNSSQRVSQPESVNQDESISIGSLKASLEIYEQISAM